MQADADTILSVQQEVNPTVTSTERMDRPILRFYLRKFQWTGPWRTYLSQILRQLTFKYIIH